MRAESGALFCFLWRSSISLRVLSTESRRDFCGARLARAATGSDLATFAIRCSALRWPEMIG
jgi:hypothetical protein